MKKKITNNFILVSKALTKQDIRSCKGFSDLSDEDLDEIICSLTVFSEILIPLELK